jgi:hypothetical protein
MIDRLPLWFIQGTHCQNRGVVAVVVVVTEMTESVALKKSRGRESRSL